MSNVSPLYNNADNLFFDIPTCGRSYSNGKEWYHLEIGNPSLSEDPKMRFEVNPDGYGPFFPDKKYKLLEQGNGFIKVVKIVEEEQSEYNDDGIIWIITGVLSRNGNYYGWHFFFNKGGDDFEPIFKKILESTQFNP